MSLKPKTKTDLINNGILLLKYRARSRHELLSRLSQHSTDSKLVHQVVIYLEELGLINDDQFTQSFIRSQLKKSKGPRQIRYHLSHRFGVDQELINHHLHHLSPEQLLSSASQYLSKHHQKLSKLPIYARISKAKNLLYQRGYSTQTIANAIDESGLKE